MQEIKIPSYTLSNCSKEGLKIPVLGFGTYKLKKTAVQIPSSKAYEIGVRLFDTANVYQNEKELGECLKGKEDVFIITKLWRSHVSMDNKDIQSRLKDHLKALKRDKIELWMMHWPGKCFGGVVLCSYISKVLAGIQKRIIVLPQTGLQK